ncbi:MAG: hypothetical protein PW735_01485 [Acidobacteriaceae bacterium]|nr:hypothetical protein [Acidobacteriaceae bacterium]
MVRIPQRFPGPDRAYPPHLQKLHTPLTPTTAQSSILGQGIGMA